MSLRVESSLTGRADGNYGDGYVILDKYTGVFQAGSRADNVFFEEAWRVYVCVFHGVPSMRQSK